MITSQSGGFPRVSAYPLQCTVAFSTCGGLRVGIPKTISSRGFPLAVPETTRTCPTGFGETARGGAARADAVLDREVSTVSIERGQLRAVAAGPACALPLPHRLGAPRDSREPALGQTQLPRQQPTGDTMARGVAPPRRSRPHGQRHLNGRVLQVLCRYAVAPAESPGNPKIVNARLHFYRPASVNVLLGALRARRISQSGILSGCLLRRRIQ